MNEAPQSEEDIELTEEEESFDLYVKVNFPDIFDNYVENQKSIAKLSPAQSNSNFSWLG